MENWQDYIHSAPAIMLGKPVIKGTRITVELIVERLGSKPRRFVGVLPTFDEGGDFGLP